MFKKLIIGLDGGDGSKNALGYAVHLAIQENAELLLVSVVEPIPPLAYTPGGPPSYIPQIMQNRLEDTTSMQYMHLEKLRETYPDLDVKGVVKEGRAAKTIREMSGGADLIVIGHRGTGGVLSWVLGSVAKEITDMCTVPVLIVKDSDYC